MTPEEEIKLRAGIARDIWVARTRHPVASVARQQDLEKAIAYTNMIVDNAIEKTYEKTYEVRK